MLAEVDHDDAELFIDTSSAGTVLSGLVSRFGLVFVALVVRFATGWAALVLAYPVARAHQRDLGLPAHSPRRVATHLDRLRVSRALRELRWTLGVRSAAIDRLGDRRRLVTHLDRAVGIANIAAGVVCALAVLGFGATVQV